MATLGQTPTQQPVETEGRRSLLLGVAGLVLTVVMLPVGLALDVLALLIGLRARRRARRDGHRLATARWAIVLAVIGLVIGIPALATQAYMWNEVVAYNDCVTGANTIAAENACVDGLEKAFEKKFSLPEGSLNLPFRP
ncbi:hypothetical protein [Bailinhaonella thermotolerans]|uniref:DUF4190 domain-containing protein n=1 Tax=Bailinhaonella thermotolerans TaxID=1070861 RepID=A0A3A4AB37_9ACTN|nr:hypothetical protein [Bailinhaonella thermotolerans]RJL23644.1 hypothetical protein D5H75_32630 [Bailinhaonella thermotolerans]